MEIPTERIRVLITGIDGFTGVHLENYLTLLGFDVYGTVLVSSDNPKHLSCDICKKEQIKAILEKIAPAYVYHLAAISFVNEKQSTKIYEVNVLGTLNLLDSLVELRINPSKIILASSATVYGNQNVTVLHEEMCPKPVNHYGNSKLVMENMAKNYFHLLNIIITRSFNYTGIGQELKFVVPKIVGHFREKKKEIQLGNIDVFREFNDVKHVVQNYHQLSKSNFHSDVVNVCTGQSFSLREIIDQMMTISGQRIKITINPDFVRANEIKVLVGSTKKLKEKLGDMDYNADITAILKGMYLGS